MPYVCFYTDPFRPQKTLLHATTLFLCRTHAPWPRRGPAVAPCRAPGIYIAATCAAPTRAPPPPRRALCLRATLPHPCAVAQRHRVILGILDRWTRLCYSGFMDDSRWHILKVKPGHEDAVAALCGVPAYVPRRSVEYFNRRMRKVVRYVKALLPGFVFVKVGAPSELRRPETRLIYGFMRNGDRTPATLTPAAFEALRVVEREANMPKPKEVVAKVAKPRVGDHVNITMALFSDAVKALVKEVKGNRVLLEVLQSNLRVYTTLDKLA